MKLEYQKLLFDGKNWVQSSIDLIKNMLEVWDNSHRIVVCHPNVIFQNKPVSIGKPNLIELNFEDLKKDLNIVPDASYTNIYPEATKTWKYICKRLNYETFVDSPRYLAIVEFDSENVALVRGIFKATKKETSIAVNPLYEEYRPKTIFEKKLRLMGEPISLNDFKNNHNYVKTKVL